MGIKIVLATLQTGCAFVLDRCQLWLTDNAFTSDSEGCGFKFHSGNVCIKT